MDPFDIVERFGKTSMAEERTVISSDVAVVFQRYTATLRGCTVDVVYMWHLKDGSDMGGCCPCTRLNSFTEFQNEALREKPWGEYL